MNKAKRNTALLLSALTVYAVTANADDSTPAVLPPTDTEIRTLLVRRVDVEKRSVGIVVGISTPHGRRIISYGNFDVGASQPLNGDTVFEIGSLTKIFTALLLADMVRRGEVALTDPLSRFLPTAVKAPKWKGREITLVDLATQTSGLPFFPTNLDVAEDPSCTARYTVDRLYEFLSGYELLRPIGVRWEYSNAGFGLLGHVLSLRAKIEYEPLVQKRISGPLGMTSTGIALTRSMRARLAVGHDSSLHRAPALDMPVLAGAGSLRSTANDMLTFLEAFLPGRQTPLSASMDDMFRTRRPGDEMLAYLGAEQALGWWVFGTGDAQVMGHGGDTVGFSSSAAFCPAKRIAIVALSNTVNSADDIAMHLLWPGFPLSAPPPVQKHTEIAVDPRLYDLYAGKYQAAPNVIFVIERRGDTLRFLGPMAPLIRLRPNTERRFFLDGSDTEIDFSSDSTGKVAGLTLKIGPLSIPARKLGTSDQP